MTGLALGLALASAFGWTLFDFSRRKVGERISAVPAVIAIMLVQTLVNLPFGGWAEPMVQSDRWWLFAILSIGANTVANVFFVLSVQNAPFTLVVPILSLTPAIAAAIGWMSVGEALHGRQIVAILIVVGAALWLGWYGEHRRPTVKERRSLFLMAATALLWAITPFFDRICNESGTVSLTIYMATQCLGIALCLLIVTAMAKPMREELQRALPAIRAGWKWVLVAAIASSIGLYFQIQGVSATHVGLFEATKRSTALILSLILGRVFLREVITREKILALLAMAAGIFLLA